MSFDLFEMIAHGVEKAGGFNCLVRLWDVEPQYIRKVRQGIVLPSIQMRRKPVSVAFSKNTNILVFHRQIASLRLGDKSNRSCLR